jgi:hypothetical protein
MEIVIICTVLGIIILLLFKKLSKELKPKAKDFSISNTQPKETTIYGPWVEKVWTLEDFCKEFGNSMRVKYDWVNKQTGEKFAGCTFIDNNGKHTFVTFHDSIGVLSKEEILKRKSELKVGLNSYGNYKLYSGMDRYTEEVKL